MTPAGKHAFALFCTEELSRVKLREGIGLYKEKRLHSVLKRWMYDDLASHEQAVFSREGKPSRFVADLLTPWGEIAEIQTGELRPLVKKLSFYLEKTDHQVTVVHPLIAKKQVCWLDPESGELLSRNRSPKREGALHAVPLLRPLLPLLERECITLLFPLIEAQEYRLQDGWGNGGKRGSHRYELFPTALLDTLTLRTKADVLALLPQDLPTPFTAKEFGKRTRLVGYDLYNALAVFEALGGICRQGKRGNSVLYALA